jgi:hypothetical protein
MNATGGISSTKAPNRSLTRQLILARDNHPFASVTRTARTLPVQSSRMPPAAPLCERSCDARAQLHRELFSSPKNNRLHKTNKKMNLTMLGLSNPGFSIFARVDEPPRFGNNLCDLDATRVVSRNEPPFWEVDSKHNKNIIYNMRRSKDHGIEITWDDGHIQRDALTSFSILNRFTDITISHSPLGQCLKLNGNPEFLNKFHDRMVTLFHKRKISSIADRVEHIESHSLAHAQPFYDVQGSHYSPADHLLTENL